MTSSSLLKSVCTVKAIWQDSIEPGPIQVAGWVRTKRSSKKFSFLELNDGSCAPSLQIIVDHSNAECLAAMERIAMGCALSVGGELVLSPGQGQKYELQAKNIIILGESNPEHYPLQKKDMSFEYLREIAHLRSRTATFSSVFRIRSQVSFAIHRFFHEQGFYYIHTPLLTTIDGEGAGESFQVTNFNLAAVPKSADGSVDFSKDFFGQNAMLCVTGQLEAELMAQGLGKVYTFGPTFRAENSNTSRHLAEFWMVEPEVAFANLEDNMELAQNLIRFIIQDVLTFCEADLDVCIQKNQINTRAYLQMSLEKPFVKITYTEAVEVLLQSGQTFEYPVFWGCDLKSEHERFLCEVHFKAPTIVYNYPEELKAFYMYLNDDGKTVRAMDILVPGIGEVVGGSQREDREDILKSRLIGKGIDASRMDWYLASRRFGSVPHAGFGVGLERLLMWITGMSNIRDVIPFPRVPGHCEF